jgi:hypothetical protein
MKTTKQFMIEKIDPNEAPPPITIGAANYEPNWTGAPNNPYYTPVRIRGAPNNGLPPKWAWQGPGLPWWWDRDGDGIIDDPYVRRLVDRYGFGRWEQGKHGGWRWNDFTEEFGMGDHLHPANAPTWETYDPRWWIPNLY